MKRSKLKATYSCSSSYPRVTSRCVSRSFLSRSINVTGGAVYHAVEYESRARNDIECPGEIQSRRSNNFPARLLAMFLARRAYTLFPSNTNEPEQRFPGRRGRRAAKRDAGELHGTSCVRGWCTKWRLVSRAATKTTVYLPPRNMLSSCDVNTFFVQL